MTAAVAGWSYAWRAARPVNIEIYYAAAVRSMAMSVSDFFFGAFDPAGTVTTDKLPGALWLQAVSVGVFGPHSWALVLPQVIEGTLTVLVLYRAVRQLAGPPAGLIAGRPTGDLAGYRRAQLRRRLRHADDPAGPNRPLRYLFTSHACGQHQHAGGLACSRLTGFTTIGDHLAGEDGYAEDTGGWLFRRPAYWMRLARISPLSMAACSSASLVAARSAKKYGP